MHEEKNKKDTGYFNYPLGLSSQNANPKDFQYFVDLLESEEVNGKEKALFILIPFCDSICTFCDLNRTYKTKDKVEKYLQALKAEIKMYSRTRYIDSSTFSVAHFSGGTPTVLSSEQLCDLLSYCKANFTFSEDTEITIESTTHNADEDKLRKLLDLGVNRLYFGVQTFDDTIRKLFYRTDSETKVVQTIKTAHKLGCTNVHIDLMYNLPGQNAEMWKDDLKKAVELDVESISISRLYVYPLLKLAKMLQSGEAPPIEGEDTPIEMYKEAVETLKNAGYKEQPTSGSTFILPGKEHKDYEFFYYQQEMLELGAINFAYGLLGKYLYRNFESLERYAKAISNGKFPIAEGVKLSKDDEMRRMIISGLYSSIDKREFEKRFGKMPEDVFPEIIDFLIKKDLIMVDEQEIKLTDLGVIRWYEMYEKLQSVLYPVIEKKGGDMKKMRKMREKMKRKNKLFALVEIAVVLCSVFLAALSGTGIAAAQEDDYVLGIYGNANEDDTIDMRDVTYTKLIIFGKKPETELADAYYDGEIDVLDVVQIKLIILGRESELTIVQYLGRSPDITEEPVTIPMPIESIVSMSSYAIESLCTFGEQDKIVGVATGTKGRGETRDVIEDKPEVGTTYAWDMEKVLELNPDIVLAYAVVDHSEQREILDAVGITLVQMNFNVPETSFKELRNLGWMLNKQERAEELINFEQQHLWLIEERVKGLDEEQKTRVYYAGYSCYYGEPTHTSGKGGGSAHAEIEFCGGINIFADLEGYVTVDPEEVIVRNPQVIYAYTWWATECPLGYDITDTGPVEECRQDIIMGCPGWDTTDAVKNGRVYVISGDAKSTHPSVYRSYLAKWFHPDLFEDVDPVAIHREWLERFLGIEYKGVYAYPTYPV